MTAIHVESLVFAYKRGPTVLDVPEFKMERGSRVFLHGPSGSGKTTLLGLLAGILDAQAGTVRVLGEDLAKLRGQARDAFRGAHLGYIFQMFNLIPYLNVRQNIILPCQISAARRARVSGALETAADELAGRLDIGALVDKPVTELSVGQQQRVAACRALIGAPELIIADEPTSALDSDHREAFLRLLFEEAGRAGSSILFVSHDHTLKGLFEQVVSLREINRASRAS